MSNAPGFLLPGSQMTIGEHIFNEQKIIEFCEMFDPAKLSNQPLSAGHWHVASIWMRLQRAHVAKQVAIIKKAGTTIPQFGPSPGMTKMLWPKEVFAGDHITFSNEILEARASRSRPQWNVLSQRSIAENQNKELVMSFTSSVFIKW